MIKVHIKNLCEECRFFLSVVGCFLTTLAWSRSVVRRGRPILYLVDSALIFVLLLSFYGSLEWRDS